MRSRQRVSEGASSDLLCVFINVLKVANLTLALNWLSIL